MIRLQASIPKTMMLTYCQHKIHIHRFVYPPSVKVYDRTLNFNQLEILPKLTNEKNIVELYLYKLYPKKV